MADEAYSGAGDGAGLSYADARRGALDAASGVKIYGVPLDNAPEGWTTVVWCGFQAGPERELRRGTERIWHVADDAIKHRAPVPGFEFRGQQVEALAVAEDYTPIEETYIPVRADGGVVATAARTRALIRFDDVPMTLDPGKPATSGPGDPPITLDPGKPASPGPGQPPTTIMP